uniref:Uncharacterized protein n=1 Tax=Thraustotheca clavata TaxID=74557 RepID=S5TQ67_9STRA|nr:hypothetical protein P181_p25 [Thraustotheca clavata]YP_008475417.1 hypothetical protein P181_p41 [Thraustotheca clavata]AGS55508.1 hypothetical protein [Thraustotheca clavata]AGS55509.1 hypothetical protein [Thraustotheca clavata]
MYLNLNLLTNFEIKYLITRHISEINAFSILSDNEVCLYERAIYHNYYKNLVKQLLEFNEIDTDQLNDVAYNNLLNDVKTQNLNYLNLNFDTVSQYESILYNNNHYFNLPNFNIPGASLNSVTGLFEDLNCDIDILRDIPNNENNISNFFIQKNYVNLEAINSFQMDRTEVPSFLDNILRSLASNSSDGFSFIKENPCELINLSNDMTLAIKNNLNLELCFRQAYSNLEYIFLQKNQFSFLKIPNPLLSSTFQDLEDKVIICNSEILNLLQDITNIFLQEDLFIIRESKIKFFIKFSSEINVNILSFAYDLSPEILNLLL